MHHRLTRGEVVPINEKRGFFGGERTIYLLSHGMDVPMLVLLDGERGSRLLRRVIERLEPDGNKLPRNLQSIMSEYTKRDYR